jgi:hypothetical protein
MIIDIEAADVEVNPTTRLLQGRFKVPCSFLESGGIPVPQRVVKAASSVRDRAVSAAKTFGGGLNFVMRGVVSFGRNWLPCSAPAAPVEVGKNPEIAASAAQVEAAAVRSVEEIGEAAQKLSRELRAINVGLRYASEEDAPIAQLLEEEAGPPPKRIKFLSASKAAESGFAPYFGIKEPAAVHEGDMRPLSKGPGEAVMEGEKTQEQTLTVVELTAEQEERLSAFLDHSQPVISAAESLSMVGRVAPATAEQLTEQLRDFVGKEKEKQYAESVLVEKQLRQMLARPVNDEQLYKETTSLVEKPHRPRRGHRRGHSPRRGRSPRRGHSRSSSTSRSRSRSHSRSSSTSRSRSRGRRPSRSRSSERGRDGGLGTVSDLEFKGGSRTRRRVRRSSTGSSTTRGRKATSRRNQSKKHKQNSRRRRSTRKSSRKN